MRAFLACRIEAADATRLHAALGPFRQIYTNRTYRWTPPANYHVTLRFFGDLPSAEVDRVGRLVGPIISATGSISCRAASPQPLPNERRPKVIVLPIDSGGRLEQLATQCNEVLGGEFGPPDKPFRAHLTVIRCRRGARFIESTENLAVPLALINVVVFESTHLDEGPRYTPLQQLQLGV